MGEKNWPKSAKKSQNSFSGLGRPCLRAGPKGPRRRRLGCRPKAGKLVTYYLICELELRAYFVRFRCVVSLLSLEVKLHDIDFPIISITMICYSDKTIKKGGLHYQNTRYIYS